MFHPSLLYLFAAFYAVFGVLVIRRLRRPSCRICLLRQGCPNRKGRFLGRGGMPCYERESEAANPGVLHESSAPKAGSQGR